MIFVTSEIWQSQKDRISRKIHAYYYQKPLLCTILRATAIIFKIFWFADIIAAITAKTA